MIPSDINSTTFIATLSLFLIFIPCAPFFQLLHAFLIRLFTCGYDVSRVHVSTRNRTKVRTVHDFRYFPSIHGFVFLRYLFDLVPAITVTVNVFSISRYILINHHDARHRTFYSMIDTSILRESQSLWSLELRFVKVSRVAFVISFFGSFCAVICIVTCETRETSRGQIFTYSGILKSESMDSIVFYRPGFLNPAVVFEFLYLSLVLCITKQT